MAHEAGEAPALYQIHARSIRHAQQRFLKEVAAQAGMSWSHLSMIERQLTPPNTEHLARLARALAVAPRDLVTYLDDPPPCACRTRRRKGRAQ